MESLNPAVFEIMGCKRGGVTSLAFQGHVTSSGMWLFIPCRPFLIGGPL